MKPHIHILSDKYDIVYSLDSPDDIDLVNAVLRRLVPSAIPQAGEFVVVPGETLGNYIDDLR